MAGPPASVEQRLPPQPSSVAEARALVGTLLEEAGRAELRDDAVLVVSEVVTNALLHAGTPIEVAARVDADHLRVEVSDGSDHLPVRRNYAATAGTGRGLMMLESMVEEWGVERHPRGKTVWFEIAAGGEADPDATRQDSRDTGAVPEAAVVDVELVNLPLLLHAAWQEHAEALLRDYLLFSLDQDAPVGGRDPIQVHADATDAIAILEEGVPKASFDIPLDRLMAEAVEPNVSVTRLHLKVPRASVSHFEVLEEALEVAIDLAARGLVLTPPTQPEVQTFRRWLCRQVRDQAAGAPPVPFSVEGDAPLPLGASVARHLRAVREATVARVAADEANRIVAISDAGLQLLGYRDADELLGRRLVTIVPERFRQAHVAGFTLYLLVGRQPLLETPVVVPALRRDGTEVEVELLVTAEHVGDGRITFLADMTPTGR
jgi:PAS domain S-box-containing protein